MTENLRCDALIVGAGITGSLMAQQLTGQGLDVVVIDRERPGRGSTAASTSMLLWEIDRSLTELTEAYDFDRAVRVYRASLQAVADLTALARQLDIRCDLRQKHSLYLAAGDTAKGLIAEHELRRRAGLPGVFLDHRALLEQFEMTRAGALLSPGSADADPVQLAAGLLKVAVSRGARVFEAEAVAFDGGGRLASVGLSNGRQIEAASVVLATGYVMPAIVRSAPYRTSSSWAIATSPQPHRLWKDDVLIWEDSKDYLYARTTSAGRIIVGGEDSDRVVEPQAREDLMPEKSRTLQSKLSALWGRATTDIEFRWSGTFDSTRDGLPLIGPVPGAKHIHAAYGYGGNGITFSLLAARIIGALIAGVHSPLLEDFALDRDAPLDL
jgi:glycine/D-amino acid oxidase-like deaminating enzyme